MLSSIVSSMNLTFWPQVALVIFFAVFVAVVIRLWRTDPQELDKTSRLPLDEP